MPSGYPLAPPAVGRGESRLERGKRGLHHVCDGTSVPVPIARACQGAAALLARRRRLALPLDRRLLVMGATLHLLKRALFQHELLQLFERGVHLVVDDIDARHQLNAIERCDGPVRRLRGLDFSEAEVARAEVAMMAA